MSQNKLRVRALCGDDFDARGEPRRVLLRRARYERAIRSWVTEGCYAWWRLTDDLKRTQRAMAALRRPDA